MNIVDFEPCHVTEAACIAAKQMSMERAVVDLPDHPVPDLHNLVHSMGVAALEDNRLVGYLCAYGPFTGMFGTMGTPFAERFVGVFSPVEAHGVATDAPARTWQRMYQAAAAKWARAGALYHAIALYEHDACAKTALFRYGFGQRCADAVRTTSSIHAPELAGIVCRELPRENADEVRELRWKLDEHLCQSPCFMLRTEEGRREWLDQVKHRDSRLFTASADGETIAFIEVCEEGENFLTASPGMANICGAYCLEQYRGRGVSQLLLNHVLTILRSEGVGFLGVDYETMNPTAAGFWEKYFQPYTASLVRRLDG